MTINVFQPSLGEEEIDAIRAVFNTSWIGRGHVSKKFEESFAKHIVAYPEQCLSISSCTEGLFLSMRLLGIGAGDEVILPSISFIGAGEAVLDCGAKPVFCDVHERTLNPLPHHVRDAYHPGRTKAIMLLHYGGAPCNDIWNIQSFARENKLALIEDSACSVSSVSKGVHCGTIGDIGVWSFDSMKILCTGDGGMMHIRDEALRAKAESMAWLCTTTKSGLSSANDEWWQVDIDGVGRRMLMNDIAASIGLIQLDKLDGFISRRQEINNLYDNLLADIQWLKTPMGILSDEQSSYYFYWIQLANATRRKALANHLRSNGIYTTFRYWPLHLIDYFRWPKSHPLIGAEHAAQKTLNLPLHQAMTDEEVRRICQTIHDFGEKQQW